MSPLDRLLDPDSKVANMERQTKDSHVIVRAAVVQIEAWKAAATAAGAPSLSAWIRDTLGKAAKRNQAK